MIGIDFGTTNSAIAHVLSGEKPVPIADPDTNEVVLPSFVYYETPDQVVVGERARAQYYELEARNGVNIFRSIKRQLKHDRTYDVFGSPVTNTDIAANIFRKLKQSAASVRGGEIGEAVVTIPVYFNADQRNAVRLAAKKADIDVKGFLHEPVAAVYPLLQETFHTQNIMVFDWGGGTLDISLLRIDDGMIYELEVGGDDELGGDDIDQCLTDNTFDWFLESNNMEPFNLHEEPTCLQRLITRSENAKRQLSDPLTADTSIEIPAFYDSFDLSRKIDKPDFESIIGALVDKAVACVRSTLKKVDMKVKDVDKLVLAGGSSQIPALIRRMEEIFGTRKVTIPQNTETCVAEGAALLSYRNLRPVLSVPVGIELSKGYIHHFLKKGADLNGQIKKQIPLVVTDNRSGLANIKIFESDGISPQSSKSRQKGLLMVPISKKELENINVEYEMDNNQCLSIRAWGLRTKQKVECKIKDVKVGYKIR
jgi:molecular chaperone DnaK